MVYTDSSEPLESNLFKPFFIKKKYIIFSWQKNKIKYYGITKANIDNIIHKHINKITYFNFFVKITFLLCREYNIIEFFDQNWYIIIKYCIR